MNGNEAKVLLDLNAPTFQSDFFDLDAAEVKKILKTLKKLRGLTWNEVFRDHGLKWEEVKSVPGKYSIRLSPSYRAIVPPQLCANGALTTMNHRKSTPDHVC